MERFGTEKNAHGRPPLAGSAEGADLIPMKWAKASPEASKSIASSWRVKGEADNRCRAGGKEFDAFADAIEIRSGR